MLGRCDDHPIDPGTQRLILKIVRFLLPQYVHIISISAGRCIKIVIARITR